MDGGGDLQPTNPPSAPEHMVAAGVVALMLEQHSRLPEANFFAWCFASLVVIVLFIAYTFRLGAFFRAGSSGRRRCFSLDWLVFPAAMAMMFSSAATHWPASVRFYLSKPSFDELIAQAHRGQKPAGFPRRVGLYWIESVQDDGFQYVNGNGTIGFVTGEALIDPRPARTLGQFDGIGGCAFARLRVHLRSIRNVIACYGEKTCHDQM